MFALEPHGFEAWDTNSAPSNRCELDLLVQSPRLGLLMKFHFTSVGNGGPGHLAKASVDAWEAPPAGGWPRFDRAWDLGVFWTPFGFGPKWSRVPPLSANGLFPGGPMVRFGGFSNLFPTGGLVVYLSLGGYLGWQQCYLYNRHADSVDFQYWVWGPTNFHLVFSQQLGGRHPDERTRTRVRVR
jgi:hypothetical protein